MSDLSIREIRKELGYSQKELAEKLNVHWRTVQNWEKNGGISQADYTNICALLKDKQSILQTANGDNNTQIAGSNTSSLDKAMDEIAEQRKLVVKAQEQIDRLMSIIEHLTK